MQRPPSPTGAPTPGRDSTSTSPSGKPSPTAAVTRDMQGLSDAARDAAGTAREQAGSMAANVKATASDLASDARSTVSDVAGDVTDKVRETAESQKARGANSVAGVARAVHSAARELEGESPQMARYAHQAADGIEDVSRAIKNQSVGDLFDTLSGVARRQPGAFFAGSVIAGVALSRFLKSSAPHRPGTGMSGRSPMPQRPTSTGTSAGGALPQSPKPAGMAAGSGGQTYGGASGTPGMPGRSGAR